MTEVVSKCGMNCAGCPWSPIVRKNIPDEELDSFRKRAKAVLGFSPTAKPCLLCLTPEEKISKDVKHWHANFRRGCPVRKCVTNMGIKNCAYCSRFPCAFEKSHAGLWTREKLEKQRGRTFTDEEYHSFIEPFEGLKRLERIHSTLKPDDIVEAITVPPLKMKVVEFPAALDDKQKIRFKPIHSLLSALKQSSLSVEDVDLAPQQTRLKNRVKNIFRFLWIFAAHGSLMESDGGFLLVDAKTYNENRGTETGLSSWNFINGVVIPNLMEFGVIIELVELAEDWKVVPSGYLRKKGWEMKLSFTEQIRGLAGLKAFQIFGKKLEEKYGKRAFRYFANVDMRLLIKS